MMALTGRRQHLQAALATSGADVLLTDAPADIRYLTGCLDAGGFLIVSRSGDPWLLTSSHDGPQSRAEVRGAEVTIYPPGDDPLEHVGAELLRRESGCVIVPSLSASRSNRLGEVREGIEVIAAAGFTANLRRAKEADELMLIRHATGIVEAGMAAARAALRPGVCEIEVAAERTMRALGSDGRVFETKVESGWRSAWPSTYASDKAIEVGDFVLIDIGPTYRGYYGDLTRTFVVGEPSPPQRDLLEVVLAAQGAALAAIRAGVQGHEVDEAARQVIGEAGHGQDFLHHTGHALGLAGDELTLLAPNQRLSLLAGECVTVEPGVYVEGVGGVRIEDEVLVKDGGAELLSAFDKHIDSLIVAA